MRRFFYFTFSLLALCMIGSTRAVAEYYVGARLTVSNVQNGDLVLLEAASTTSNYGYYLKETSSGFFWKEGIGDNCVWRLISTGASDTYYFQNVSTGNYIAGDGKTVATCTVSPLQSDAIPIKLKGWDSSWFKYSAYPQGWDTSSTIIANSLTDYNLGNRVFSDAKDNGTFNQDGLHCCPWNIFKVSQTSGVPFSSFTNTQNTFNGILIGGLTYDLNTALLTPTGQLQGNFATLTTANQNLNVESVHIPATISYSGMTYKVTTIAKKGFMYGKFSTLTFESPSNLTTLDDWTFCYCNKVKEVVVPEGVHTLSYARAFSQMDALETVTLPTTITTLAGWSFGDDPAFTTLIFQSATPPTLVNNDVFAGSSVPANITIVVPTDEAIASYQAIKAFTNHPTTGRNVRQIISNATYIATSEALEIAKLKTRLQTVVDIGVGVVNGVKDEASKTELEAVINNTDATLAEVQSVVNNLDNYRLLLGNGYYRIIYPMAYNGLNGNNYLRFGNDLKLYADCEEDDYSDYSTVFKVTVTGTESRAFGDGYRITLTSQGLSPTNPNVNSDVHQMMGTTESQFAIAINQTATPGAFLLGISDASGNYIDNKYIYKKPTDEAKKIHQTNGNAQSCRCFIVPATDITVKMNKVGDEYWATLYVPFGVTLPSGTEAYVGAVDGGVLRLTSIGQDVPAATPVVLCGDAANITATINDEIAAYTGTNGLSGQYLAASSRDDNIRSLGVKDGVIGFYKLPSASTGLGANKAFLNLAGGSNFFKIVIGDDDVTGVNDVQSSMANGQYYDLFGRKVAAPVKGGLYIKNGKVVKE